MRNEGFRDGFRGSRGGGPSFAPVKVGDEMEVTIEGVGEKGDGIARINRFVIFVPGTKQGEKVKVKITKVVRKVGFGEVVGRSEGGSEEQPTMEAEEPTEEQEMEATEEEK